MRHLALSIAALALVASCAPPEPYEDLPGLAPYGGSAQASAAPVVPGGPGPVNSYASATGAISSGPITAGPIGAAPPAAAQTGAPLSATAPAAIPPGTTAVAAATAAPPAPPASHSGISDEQDFSAVASRETIESDRARMEQNRAQYQQVTPGELPQRQGQTLSPIIEYAINAPNRLGQSMYTRGGLALSNHDRACARYDTPAEAQEAFLRSGGPRRDPKNLDPDGDGFACAWDPTPFQAVRNVTPQAPAAGLASPALLPGQGG